MIQKVFLVRLIIQWARFLTYSGVRQYGGKNANLNNDDDCGCASSELFRKIQSIAKLLQNYDAKGHPFIYFVAR